MNVSIYDPAAARDLMELRQYIHTTISQTRRVELGLRLDVIMDWLKKFGFDEYHPWQQRLALTRFTLGNDFDSRQPALCAEVLESLLQALPADVC